MEWRARQICFAPSQDITSMTPLHAFEKKVVRVLLRFNFSFCILLVPGADTVTG